MAEFITAMISSTFIDLKLHRQQAILTCLKADVFPLAMELIPATNDTPLNISLKMVDRADIYIGIFGYRYGSIPENDDISITHQEYLHACRRDIPRLIFCMNEQHPVTIRMVDVGDKGQYLEELRRLIQQDRVVAYFNSPEELGGKIFASIQYLINRGNDLERKFRYLPHNNRRHEWGNLIGREKSLASMNRWVMDTKSEEYKNNIYVIRASSGMGKSLLAWRWFESIPNKNWKKIMWWSLYQKEDFETFLKQALVNFIGKGEQEISNVNNEGKTAMLLKALRNESFLIVLDGLEHALANGESKSIAIDKHTVDPPIETFLKKFRELDTLASRILITTTSTPKALVKENGEAHERVYKHILSPLTSDEALELWSRINPSKLTEATKNNLLSLIIKFDYHPLFISALAGEVKQSGGNFKIWWNSNKNNQLGTLQDISIWMSNLLNKKLGSPSRDVLLTISAFYCPCRYNLLSTLMLESGFNQNSLDVSLRDLEARCLINRISEDEDNEIENTYSYRIHQLIIDAGWGQQTKLKQIEIAKRLFNILINNGYYNNAYEIFIGRLNFITFDHEYNSLRIELLEKLFPQGINNYPALTDRDKNIGCDKKAITMASLVRGYLISGEIEKALLLSRQHVNIRKESGYMIHAAKGQYYLSYELYLLGKLNEAEERIKNSIAIFNNENQIFWKVLCLRMLAHILITRDAKAEALQVRNSEPSISPNVSHNTDDMIDEIAHIKNQTELLSSIAAEVNHVEKHLLQLTAEAERYLSERRYVEARNIITEVLSNNNYRLIQANAWLILAKIEQSEGNIENTISAASNAYKKAWCDGSSYIYKQALEQAKNILDEYDRTYPEIN